MGGGRTAATSGDSLWNQCYWAVGSRIRQAGTSAGHGCFPAASKAAATHRRGVGGSQRRRQQQKGAPPVHGAAKRG
jgi:hypothetical protein